MSTPEVYDPYTHSKYGEVITAMVTPFGDDGELNLGAATDLVDYLVENGTQGIVVAGTTGESPTLTPPEHLRLIRHILEVSPVPVLAGTGSNSTSEAIDLSRSVLSMSAFDPEKHGLLHVVPYYNRPTQNGLVRHFEDVAEAVHGVDVVMYDIPIRTGEKLATENILRLAGVDNIVGLKDATGADNLADSKKVIEEAPEGFMVFSGDDGLNLHLYRIGAVGAISVASHWAGKEMAEMFRADSMGETDFAEQLDHALQPSYAFEGNVRWRNPEPAKAMMNVLGLEVGECRSPMGVVGEDEKEALDQAAAEILKNLESIR